MLVTHHPQRHGSTMAMIRCTSLKIGWSLKIVLNFDDKW